MSEPFSRSWALLQPDEPAWALPEGLRQRDPLAAQDCGWVGQMLPFLPDLRQVAPPDADWVIDPFGGFGSTAVAAHLRGHRAVCVETDPLRSELAAQRLAAFAAPLQHQQRFVCGSLTEPATLAALRALGQPFTRCLTNIPYFGAPPLRALPAGAPQLYGSEHYEPYLQQLRQVFVALEALLAPGAWCVVMAQNLRLGSRFVPLAWDVARLLAERFELQEERLLVYEPTHRTGTAAGLGALEQPSSRSHEYALVCRKPARAAMSLAQGRALLAELQAAGFVLRVLGSFARALAGDETATPQDLDLGMSVAGSGGDAQLSALVQWLEQRGFRIESWNAATGAPISQAAMGYRHYLRARRLTRQGEACQIDLMWAAS